MNSRQLIAVKTTEVGRRYSRRKQLPGGAESLDVEVHHIFSGATGRYKKWALQYLKGAGVPAQEVVERAISSGWINEGAALREHVAWMDGTDADDGISLAARIYELCRLVEEFQSRPEMFMPNVGLQHIFELGRVSMLARVYGIDDAVINERVERARKTNKLYTDAMRAKWLELRITDFSAHTKRRAAELIAQRLGLPETAAETIRKTIT